MKMTPTELAEILANHAKWLADHATGSRANLTRADLTGANLHEANLTRANLIGAYLHEAALTRANLSGADLTRANLTDATIWPDWKIVRK
jgi:uncharacterized protein YjbI with pentapeptide repeats